MIDAIQPSPDEYHAAYAASFKLWSELRRQAQANPSFPAHALELSDAFPQHPRFLSDLVVKHAKYPKHSWASVSGFSEWGSPCVDCQHGMPSFQQLVEITVSTKNPISVCIDQTSKNNGYFENWFPLQDQNYIPILILGWAYVLSARWTELMPGQCSIAYTDAQAPGHNSIEAESSQHTVFEVFVGSCSPEEARWWAAVLAPGRGWEAMMLIEDDELLAPWSTSLAHGIAFTLSDLENHSSSPPAQNTAVSSAEAIQFLDRFSKLHNAEDQSLTALAAALLLPSQQGTNPLILPKPKTRNGKHKITSFSCLDQQHDGTHPQRIPQHDDLDRLLTLSCHARGIQSNLLSVFYESGVECNKAGPWMQGALDVATPLLESEPWVLGQMLMERLPEIGPLWLGATVLGLQGNLLKQAGHGPVNLNAAAWSGTVQSFLQEPSLGVCHETKLITRADECRLLYLAQADDHSRAPFCQWAPFGATEIEYTDIEVRMHKDCRGHTLQHNGFTWNCVSGGSQLKQSTQTTALQAPRSPSIPDYLEPSLPSPESLNHTKEFISEVATRSIFGWLRFDGYAPHEKDIWTHEWLYIYESDEEEELVDEKSQPKSFSHVSSWVQALESRLVEGEGDMEMKLLL
ncbi:hypothetical protein AK830_g1622 [Neonectria ditissima]|uniref:Uncharacterized protein n=1 Tax=Neonectria ditissima TaxID=78410 RepID=A0A0P7BTZ7_9HYPO|nr:hypothetical protein AK830_g1622 [Neonectria ditissima]